MNDQVTEVDAKIMAYSELLVLDQRWDPESCIIHFVDGQNVYVRAKAIPIGSWGRSESWRWAWPNESLPPAARNASMRLKELGQLTGRADFLNEKAFPVTSVDVKKLVADACHYLDSAGVCNLASEQAVWWFALDDIEQLLPLNSLTDRAADAASEVLVQGKSVMILNALRARFPGLKLQLIGRDLRGTSNLTLLL